MFRIENAWKLGITAGLVAAVCMLFTGCSQPPPSPPKAPAAPKAATAKAETGKPIKLAGIIFQEDQFFRMVLFGMREAAKKAGVELLEGNSNSKPEKEIELINTYVARKVDAILISPLSTKGSITALKLAHDKGVKIIAHNTPVESDVPSAYIGSDAEDLGAQTGQAARKYIEEKLGGKAKIAIVAFKCQVPEQSDARTRGFKKEVSQLPGVEFVAEQDAWLPEMAVRKVGDILTAHPEVNIVWAANEGGTVGAVLAVKNAGKAGQVVVFGTDVSVQLLGFLKSDENILQAITGQRPVEVGMMAVDFALKVIKGEPVEKEVIMKGVCLTRDDAPKVAEYEKKLQEWMGKGTQ